MDRYITRKVHPGTRVDSSYAVPVASLSAQALTDEQCNLTLQARSSFGKPPPPFAAWSITDTHLHVPRFYGMTRFGLPEHDARTRGQEASDALVFQGTLTEVQKKADVALHDGAFGDGGNGGGIVSLPCGYGKTVFAVYQACRLKRRTLVLVHKSVIRDQWRESFERFCPGVRVGIYQGNLQQLETEYDVVVAMIMTVAKRSIPDTLFDGFGLVVCDEAHHLAAPIMNTALQKIRCHYVLGLTATKHRPDNLTPLLHWCLGPNVFHVERESEGVRVSVAILQGSTPEIVHNGNPMLALMVNRLAQNNKRNAFIARRIVAYRARGRVIMVLSDRLVQLSILRGLVIEAGIPEDDVGIFKGGMKDAERVAQLKRPVVLCSYGMANEGVDKREADTCILATPKGRITQAIGRIQRPCETKQTPLVLDIADEDADIFKTMRWSRQRLYARARYPVQVLTPDADGWFE